MEEDDVGLGETEREGYENRIRMLESQLECEATAFSPQRSLARSPPIGGAPLTPQAHTVRPTFPAVRPPPAATKRQLTSPDEAGGIASKPRTVAPLREAPPPVGGILTRAAAPLTTTASISTASEEETEISETGTTSEDLTAASRSALLNMATTATKGIMDSVRAKSSKLNKDEVALIGGYTERIVAVFAALYGRLIEAEVKLASGVAPSGQNATTPASNGLPPLTYAERVRAPRPPSAGPTLAFYPREEAAAELPTADATKTLLKKSIAPAALNIKIENVRKVGRAGVVIQTKTIEDAQRLKEAAPAMLQVREPQKRDPLVALRGVDSSMTLETMMDAVHDQNFKDNSEWPLDKLKRSARMAFKKRAPRCR